MAKNFAESRYNVEQGRLHTLITHAFSNQRFFSWMFDIITIYFFGTSIERRYGGNRLLRLYLLGALLGGIVMATS
jgi:membrane associated rhomboid family serine protease